jgi:glutamyl-tRNA synthetase
VMPLTVVPHLPGSGRPEQRDRQGRREQGTEEPGGEAEETARDRQLAVRLLVHVPIVPIDRPSVQCRMAASRGREGLTRYHQSMPDDQATTPNRARIAPSPTGPLHIGTARTALFNYLFARHTGGTFILRLEDTDQARSSIAYEKDILDGLHWLGLHWDEGPEVAGGPDIGPYPPYRQMRRAARHTEAAATLLAKDLAYPCYCTPEELEADRRAQEAAHEPPGYVGRCANLTREERAAREAEGRRGALRFRVPPGRIRWDDLVRSEVEIDTANLGGDFVIVRSDGSPLYHFAVVVDDAEMEISHIIRGEDHISNTPKHILLFRALAHAEPQFAHLPLILNADRTKMSKRKSQTAVSDYIAEGFIREALVNYLALLGWATGTEEEILSIDEIAERFELTDVHKGGAVFDRERLEWLNGQWIRRLEPDDLVDRLRPFAAAELAAGRIDWMPSDADLRVLLPIISERLPTLGAIGDLVGFLWVRDLPVDPALLVPKRWDAATTQAALAAARDAIADTGTVSFEADELEPPLRALAESRGWKAGDLFMAIRVAVTGRTATPPLFDTLVALGRERALERLDRAVAALEEGSVPR